MRDSPRGTVSGLDSGILRDTVYTDMTAALCTLQENVGFKVGGQGDVRKNLSSLQPPTPLPNLVLAPMGNIYSRTGSRYDLVVIVGLISRERRSLNYDKNYFLNINTSSIIKQNTIVKNVSKEK